MRKMILIAACALAFIAVGARIAWVNAQAVVIPAEHYAMGEWVDLSGTYFNEAKSEPKDGYSMRVNSAEAMTIEEYVQRYGKGGEATGSYVAKETDREALVVLEYEVKNEGNDQGGIILFQHKLVPERKNGEYGYIDELWWLAEPQMKDAPGQFSLKKDSTYTTSIPFAIQGKPDYLQKYDHQILLPVGDDSSFELALSNAPVKKIIDIELS